MLSKLILMLSSEHDGEVIAAARALDRKLKAEGHDWHWLAAKLSAPSASAESNGRWGAHWNDPPPRYHTPPPPPPREPPLPFLEARRMAKFVWERRIHLRHASDVSWIEGLRNRFKDASKGRRIFSLSESEAAILRSHFTKMCRDAP